MPQVSIYVGEQNASVIAEAYEIDIGVNQGQRGQRGSKIFFGPFPPTLSLTPEEYGEDYLLDDVFIVTQTGTYQQGDVFKLTYDDTGGYKWTLVLDVQAFSLDPPALHSENIEAKKYIDQQLELLTTRLGIDSLLDSSPYTHGVAVNDN